MGWAVVVSMVIFLVSGTAIAYVAGASTVLAYLASDKSRYLAILPQRIFAQLDVFALMAMPLFILTGEIMNRAGITKALIDFSMSVVGRLKGGLGHVNIMTSVFFAGISGSAVADAAALSNTLVPAMEEQGYKRIYAAAVTAASSVIGPIIPPSIILIIYGALMETSVAALFVAGIIPGLLLAFVLFAVNAFYAYRDNHPGGRNADLPPFWPSFVKAAPALALPIIIVGGIIFGVVTPTEAATLSVVTATLVGMLYGGIDRSVIWEALTRTAILSGAIFIILSAVACLGYLAGLLQWPQQLGNLVAAGGFSGLEYLLVMNLIFLIAGMIMDVPVALTLLVPILAPVALQQGIDPVHLGIVLCFNLCIGLITPPLGGCLIVTSTVAKVNYWELARAVLPFALAELVVLGCLVLIPELSLFLPRLAGFVSR
ncbi:TRAP transporter large permease [Oceanibacterium hippocampi]|uniref:TRAP transporter large permease protein n=1 Tax=Oceanibacterium hippocampi TaxID=745714 RepID=A0A1Y5TR19_9PROT|nr:TRAP transporter large permease [Oceanibacterium hippocampi]SLN70127.1 Sialic acid TRAP transporter permease protein SiaT [Oceanibacterium hippocampi]